MYIYEQGIGYFLAENDRLTSHCPLGIALTTIEDDDDDEEEDDE